MRNLISTLALLWCCATAYSQFTAHGEPQPQSTIILKDCVISARVLRPDGSMTKEFRCGKSLVGISGEWDDAPDMNGRMSHHELKQFFFGERANQGVIAGSSLQFTKCEALGSRGNPAGYMTQSQDFKCEQAVVQMRGSWGEEYQGHWVYHLEFGEVVMEPQWVEDVAEIIHFSRSYQKYCPTPYGFRLCGWVDTPKVDRGKPPLFKR